MKKLVFKMHFELTLKTFSLCDRVEQERARLLEVGQPYMRWDQFFPRGGNEQEMSVRCNFNTLNTSSLCDRVEHAVWERREGIAGTLCLLALSCMIIFAILIPALWGFPPGYTPFFPA